MAVLNFVGNAAYGQPMDDKDNIAVFELITMAAGVSVASVLVVVYANL